MCNPWGEDPSTKVAPLVLGTTKITFPSTKRVFLVRGDLESGGNWFFGHRPEK